MTNFINYLMKHAHIYCCYIYICDKNQKIESFHRIFTSIYLILYKLNNSQKVHQMDQFFYKSGNLVGGKLKSENRPQLCFHNHRVVIWTNQRLLICGMNQMQKKNTSYSVYSENLSPIIRLVLRLSLSDSTELKNLKQS